MVSSLISGAVALLLILTGGYVIASGILTIAETTSNSQIEMAQIEDNLLQSRISNLYSVVSGSYDLTIGIANNGSTTFGGSDFDKMDLYVYDTLGITRYTHSTTSNMWSYSFVNDNDRINKGMWDPSEVINVSITLTNEPQWVKFVTQNGVSVSTNL